MPETMLMLARRLGSTANRLPVARRCRRRRTATGAGGCRRPVAAAERQDRLSAAGTVRQRPADRGDRRRRLDRLGNLRPRRHFWRRPFADHRKFGTGAACACSNRSRPNRAPLSSTAALPISAIANGMFRLDRRLRARHCVPCRRAQARAAARARIGTRASRPTCSARSMSPMRRLRPAPRPW